MNLVQFQNENSLTSPWFVEVMCEALKAILSPCCRIVYDPYLFFLMKRWGRKFQTTTHLSTDSQIINALYAEEIYTPKSARKAVSSCLLSSLTRWPPGPSQKTSFFQRPLRFQLYRSWNCKPVLRISQPAVELHPEKEQSPSHIQQSCCRRQLQQSLCRHWGSFTGMKYQIYSLEKPRT